MTLEELIKKMLKLQIMIALKPLPYSPRIVIRFISHVSNNFFEVEVDIDEMTQDQWEVMNQVVIRELK